MSANDRQVGGKHYKDKGGEEHWDRAWRLKYDPFQYIITKWVERWREKGGVEDLRKAQHAIEKYIELNTPKNPEEATPQELAHGVYVTEQIKGGWTVEGYFGDMTQEYRCPVCRKYVRATSFGHALEQHDACSGSKLTV